MKKIISLVVASIAFLTLSACSSDEKGMDSPIAGCSWPGGTGLHSSVNGWKNCQAF